MTTICFNSNTGRHSVRYVDEYKRIATELKGVAKVGAMNCNNKENRAYGVNGYPTVKIYHKNSIFDVNRDFESVTEKVREEVLREKAHTVSVQPIFLAILT